MPLSEVVGAAAAETVPDTPPAPTTGAVLPAVLDADCEELEDDNDDDDELASEEDDPLRELVELLLGGMEDVEEKVEETGVLEVKRVVEGLEDGDKFDCD